MPTTGLDRWHDYMKSHDDKALWELLHPDAAFESPVVHTPQRGREITFKYLTSAGKVLGGEGFRYVGGHKPTLLLILMTFVVTVTILGSVFNMLPVAPLDGGNVLAGLLPESLAAGYDRLVRPYGFIILIVLMATGWLYRLVGPPMSLLMGWLLP